MHLAPIRFHLSAYGSLLEAFQKNIRMWYLQKKQNTNWHIWHPPGVVFVKTKFSKKDVLMPPLSDWYFPPSFSPDSFEKRRYKFCNIDITTHDAKWIVKECVLNPEELYVVVTEDLAQLFHVLYTYVRAYNMDPYELNIFPNLRILCSHHKYVDKFFSTPLVKNMYVHLDAVKSFAKFSSSSRSSNFLSSFTSNWPFLSSSSYYPYDAFFSQNMINRISLVMAEMGEVHICSNSEENIKLAIKSLMTSTGLELFEPAFPFPHYLDCTETNSFSLAEDLEKKRTEQKNKSVEGNTKLNEYFHGALQKNKLAECDKNQLLKSNEEKVCKQHIEINDEKKGIKKKDDNNEQSSPLEKISVFNANDMDSMWTKKRIGSSISTVSNILLFEKNIETNNFKLKMNKKNCQKTVCEDTHIKIFMKSEEGFTTKENTNEIFSYINKSKKENVQEKAASFFLANFVRVPPRKPNFRLKNSVFAL